jgi:hypothetical protein
MPVSVTRRRRVGLFGDGIIDRLFDTWADPEPPRDFYYVAEHDREWYAGPPRRFPGLTEWLLERKAAGLADPAAQIAAGVEARKLVGHR